MKKLCLLILINIFLFSCAPVLTKDLMQKGIYSARLSEIKQDPVANKGKLFILGGIVVKTTVKKEGSLVEAIFVPVDSMGYLKRYRAANERFLAIYRSKEILDPLIYREQREITLAGEFVEIRKGTIGEMEYDYPFFEIKEIYLWEEYKETGYYPPPYYPAPYYRYRYSPFYDYYPYYPWWYY